VRPIGNVATVSVTYGWESTPAADNFDPSHPLYERLGELAEVRQQHKALRFGAQIHRYSEGGPGIYAFSRTERDEKVEYVVALNNAESAEEATIETFSPNTQFQPVYGDAATALTDHAGNLTIEVPALGAVVYKAERKIPTSKKAPEIEVSVPGEDSGRFEIAAKLSTEQFSEVTFAVRVGNGRFRPVGTDDNAPYRVFYDASDLEPGTKLTAKAIVNDLNGHLRSDETRTVVGETSP
jgi:alpha-amylase